MDKNNKLDIEINKFLREKDNLEVTVEIIKGIDYILKSINEKRQSKKINRELMIASIIGLIVITSAPFSVKAYINQNYKYIPESGMVTTDDGLKYILERPIYQNLNKSTDITLRDININEANNEISVKKGGISVGTEDENLYSYTFKLPYPKSDKLYIKFEGNRYNIKGNWSFTIE